MKRPNTCANLIKAINQIDKSGDPVRFSRAMANVIVGQILPDGVVKGGSSMMFRYGGEFTRYTRDMDTARVMSLVEYKQKLEDALKVGWNGFTGVLSDVPPPKPKDVPESYVMIPFNIKLSYCGRSWQTVRVLALVAGRLAHLVEDASSLGSVRLGIRPALRADVLACRHS